MKKKVICNGPGCAERRIHFEDPHTPRGPQYLDVPEEYTGKAYCSITCAMLDGYYKKDGDTRTS